MEFFDIVILAFATWRLSSLLVDPEDDGPWEVFGKFRHLMGVRHDETSGMFYGKNFAAQALLCVWCSSVYVGIVITVFYIFIPIITVMTALPLALSAGAVLINQHVSSNGDL